MKPVYTLILFLSASGSFAQIDTSISATTLPQTVVVSQPSTAPVIKNVPSPGYNKYGDLLADDPAYNKRYPVLTTAARVATTNVFNWALSRYLFHFEWAEVAPKTWKYNLSHGLVWDDDHFGTNFIGHPHTGNNYFNVARSNGYNYWQSLPFSVGGSLMWEYFGENTQPSRNDLVNTPLSGAFLGEILYRVSSNILDDRKQGRSRVWREMLAGLVNPPRGLNRLTQGKMFRVTQKEVYQKEPLNMTFSGGIHKINNNNKFGSGPNSFVLNMQLDYGDAFEVRRRKPFDVFRLRTESIFGVNRKLLGSATGYGLLFGKNILKGRHSTLLGGFQYFDYWNNRVFEVGSLGFGVGLIARNRVSQNSVLFSSLHFAAVPLAGTNTSFGPDTSLLRDYHFGGGFEAKIEETFHLSKVASLGFAGYYYWIHNYEGPKGNSSIGILKPRFILNLSSKASIGIEHHVYYNNRFIDKVPTLHLARTEQRIFFQLFLEDRRRNDRYR